MIKGIDISSWRGDPNFDLLKSSISFLIVKSSEGVGYKDPKLQRNQSEARRVALGFGYYHFCRPDLGNTPEAEANWFLSCVGDIKGGEMLVLDFEVNYSDKVNWCKKFLDYVSSKTNGTKPLIYLNKYLITSNDWSLIANAGYGIWIAFYDNDPNNLNFVLPYWKVLAMKQYTSSGQLGGITGNIDINTFFGDINAFKKYGFIAPVELTFLGKPQSYWIQVEKDRADLMTQVGQLKDQLKTIKQNTINKLTEIIKSLA